MKGLRFFFAALITLLAWLPPAAATQLINNTIDPTTESGTDLATDLNNAFNSLISSHSGTSRPSYAVAGTIWVNPVSSTFVAINVFDGTNDIALASYNPTTHAMTLAANLPASVALTGSPTAPTPSAWDNSTKIATTGFVNGTPLSLVAGTIAATQAVGDTSIYVATDQFVNATPLTLANGTTAVTQVSGDNSTKVATTAFVKSQTSIPAALGVGAIIMACNSTGSVIAAGASTPSSNLYGPVLIYGPGAGGSSYPTIGLSGDSITGSWRALTTAPPGGGTCLYPSGVTLFQRVS